MIDYASEFLTHQERPQRSDVFPRCKLHGVRIVNALPDDCPLKAESPLVAIANMQDELCCSRQMLQREWLASLERCEICNGCAARMLNDMRIAQLRQRQIHRDDSGGPHAIHSTTMRTQAKQVTSIKGKVL